MGESTANLTLKINRPFPLPTITRHAQVPVEGDLWVEGLSACEQGQTCRVAISFIQLGSIGTLSLDGDDYSNFVALNSGSLDALLTPVPDTETSVMTISEGSRILVYGFKNDDEDPRGTLIPLDVSSVGHIDWASRQFGISIVAGDPESLLVELSLVGDVANRPPMADAGVDIQAECTSLAGAQLVLNGRGSTDPDGASDLASYQWTIDIDGVRRPAGGGVEVPTVLPLGDARVLLRVSDRHGSSNTDVMNVSVQDTAPPVLTVDETSQDCLWPPDHGMRLLRLGDELRVQTQDACHGDVPAASVRIVDVWSNQEADGQGDGSTTPDFVFGDDAVCLRSERSGGGAEGREYHVVLETTDASGNSASTEVIVRVPHDSRPGSRCANGDALERVEADDTRCYGTRAESDTEGLTPSSHAVTPNPTSTRHTSCQVGVGLAPATSGHSPMLGLLLTSFGWLFTRRRRCL